MNKTDIIDFFDRLAPVWDAEGRAEDEIINKILDLGCIKEGARLLDVACGTGVLFPFYIERGVDFIGVDISKEMLEIAKSKFPAIKLINADILDWDSEDLFDTVMVYNAFPHFPDPERLIGRLSRLLKIDGRLIIAHGMSREELNRHHSGSASKVSVPLIEASALSKLFEPYFDVDVTVSDDKMYMVSGRLKNIY